MYVACSTLGFGHLPLDEALRTIGELRFTKVDLAIHADGPHLRPSEIQNDIHRVTALLKASNLAFAAFRVDFGSESGQSVLEQLKSVCRLARVLAAPVVSVPTAPIGSDLSAEIPRLTEWTKIAAADGVILTVETDHRTLTADPLGAIELCKRVRGLGLAFDPSHYLIGPHHYDNPENLFPYIRHVRLRDTRSSPPTYQVKVGQGEIEYGRIISQLERRRYERVLSVEIVPNEELGLSVDAESRKLKYLLESLI